MTDTDTNLPAVFDPVVLPSMDENYMNPARFDQIWRVAKAFSMSDLVPTHFKQKPENCFVALQMAFRSKIDPMVALQNLYLVQGKPGMSATLAIALANTSGQLKGCIRFTEVGKKGSDDYAITAKATTKDGYDIETTVSMQMAKAEAWTKNPKYLSMPDVMLKYRAATFLIRQHLPQVLLGLHTADEWEDVSYSQGKPVNVTPESPPRRGRASLPAEPPTAPALPPPADDPIPDVFPAEAQPSPVRDMISKYLGLATCPDAAKALLKQLLDCKRLVEQDMALITAGVNESRSGETKTLKSLVDNRK
jgi:hypothetical protein